ncbi:MAG: carotenoid biosynthesis protein [Marinoscillum sp.]
MSYLSKHFLVWIVIILHVVGAVCTIIPYTKELVQPLTPINLLISTFLIISVRRGSWSKFITFLLTAFVIGFLVEVIGVKTGYPFGDYSYGRTLGWKLFDVPLIIGVNWFLLSYAFGTITNRFNTSQYVKIIVAALSMVCLDFLIEPVAITLDFWSWAGDEIPLQNYFSWFVIALIIQVFFQSFLSNETNDLSIPMVFSQVFYFFFVYISLYF